MYRSVKYSTEDYYLSYLDLSLHSEKPWALCGGRFYSYLKNNLGIVSLPYDLKLIDLILDGDNTDELFVELPSEYFISWVNYPFLGEGFNKGSNELINNSMYFNINIIDCELDDLSDFLHPYDLNLKELFHDAYKTAHPKNLIVCEHPNGRKFRPYESYVAYWRAYVVFEVIQGCKFVERYLNKADATEFVKKKFKDVNDVWVGKYRAGFNRLSLYRSFVTRARMSRFDCRFNYCDISDYVLRYTGSSVFDLKSDMTNLLIIYNEWEIKHNSTGLGSYSKAMKLLKRDIYFLFEWLCYSGMKEADVFELYSHENANHRLHLQLNDVLDFEEIKFADLFVKYTPHYSMDIHSWLSDFDLNEIYKHLESFGSFMPWMRGFYDIHLLINAKHDVELAQPRIIDNLLVMAVRTEITIREIFSAHSGCDEPDLLREIFLNLPKHIGNDKASAVFCAVADKTNWSLTMLRQRPDDIFSNVDSCFVGKAWSAEQRHFFKTILRFVTARNYFAHHSYKDEELNSNVSKLGADVLVSCLHSILYVAALSFKSSNNK